MMTVILYGHLARQFGKRHQFAIRTPAEAVRALSANFKDFRQAVIQDGQAAYHVRVGQDDRADAESLHMPASEREVIKIIPAIGGSGNGLGKVLLGAALIGLSFIPGLQAPLFAATWGPLAGVSAASIMGSIGFSLVLGGVSSMLFKPNTVKSTSSERPNNRPSYAFNGAINTVGQGNPVPLAYGRLRVGSQVISAGLRVEQT